jgi:adenylate kinase
MYDVIYLTGAPAAGKSSAARRLAQRIPGLEVWEFGDRLMAHLRSRLGDGFTQLQLREMSAKIATPEDIADVDGSLIGFTSEARLRAPVLIDSHPVTKEGFGYRVTPFGVDALRRLAPTQIWMLYTDPQVAVDRIMKDPEGRPSISLEEARMHTQMQASVACIYGVLTGHPVHFFDSTMPEPSLDEELAGRIKLRPSV